MSKVKVRYLGLIQNEVGGEREELELPDGTTLQGLLQVLSEAHGKGFRAMVLTRDGLPRQTVSMRMDGKTLNLPDDLGTELIDRSEVTILVSVAPIAGG